MKYRVTLTQDIETNEKSRIYDIFRRALIGIDESEYKVEEI